MKNKKMNLSELKVKSFVTDLKKGKENTVKGGGIESAVASRDYQVISVCGPACDVETWFGNGCDDK